LRTLLLGKKDVSDVLDMRRCIGICEKAYVALSEGSVISFPRIWLKSEFGGLLQTCVVRDPGYLAVKLLTRGVQTITLVDYAKGCMVVMDGSHITGLRTGAAAALSAKYLARGDSRTVGVLGTGFVARHSLWAMTETMKVESAKAYSRSPENRARFSHEMGERLGIEVHSAPSAADAVRDADIIVTATSAEEPVLLDEDVPPGAHIGAMGIQPEVDPRLFTHSRVFAELLTQSRVEGKLSNAIKAGAIGGNIVFPELGDVVAGKLKGRTSPYELTLYDSQGLAAHDAYCAWDAYTCLSEKGSGKWVDMDISRDILSY
jgi:alanine dehydrogenase